MTDMENINKLAQAWIEAKAAEAKAVEKRRQLEDEMTKALDIGVLEGTETAKPAGYIIKVTGRIDRKVDGDKVQELAAEHGLTEHLSSLFRWKPEINLTQWRNASELITGALAPAITAKPGRPSFAITKE